MVAKIMMMNKNDGSDNHRQYHHHDNASDAINKMVKNIFFAKLPELNSVNVTYKFNVIIMIVIMIE